MRKERMDGITSARRDSTVEENLVRFAEMTKGTEEGQRWCVRAKISVDDPNKALRDPVIYRCNTLPHHRTAYVETIRIGSPCILMPQFSSKVISGRCIQPMTLRAL